MTAYKKYYIIFVMGKRIIKNIVLWLFVPLLIIYCTIYFALPYFANKKDYSKKITDILKETTNLIFLIDDYKIKISPALNLTIEVKEIQGHYPNNIPFLITKNTNINISTLYLLKKEIKINKIKADEIQFSTKLLKTGKTTLQEYIDKNTNKTVIFKVSQKTPDIYIKKYLFKIKDEESGQKFKINGTSLKASQSLDFGYINFETKGQLYCFEKKYTQFDTKITIPKNLFKDFDKKLFDISTDELYKYNFYAELKSDIKLYEKNGQIDTFSGKIDIDKFSINLETIKLPESHIHIDSDKKTANITSRLYTATNEFTDINATLKLQKPYAINIKCNCESAEIANLQKIYTAISKILKVKNSLSDFTTNGKIIANFELDTNFKTIKSNGKIVINNATLNHKQYKLNISKINSLIDFSNNKIRVNSTNLLINDQPLKIAGNIDTNANGNILLSAKNLDVKNLVIAIPNLKIPKDITINNGKLTFDTELKGKLLEPKVYTHANLTGLSLYDKKNKLNVNVQNTSIDLNKHKNNIQGKANANIINLIQKSNKNIINNCNTNNLIFDFNNNQISIKQSDINIDGSKFLLSGLIKHYNTDADIALELDGKINTKSIESKFSNQYKFNSKGNIPVKLNINGKPNNIKITATIISNAENYITPIQINNVYNKTIHTSLNGIITNNNIQINDLSMYDAPNTKQVTNSKLKKYFSIKGKIINTKSLPKFENLTVNIPNYLQLKIPQTDSGKADFIGIITLNDNVKEPAITGYITIKNTDIPDYKTKIENINTTFSKNKFDSQINNVKILDSILSLSINADSKIFQTKSIENIKIDCQTINLETLNKIIQMFHTSSFAPGTNIPINVKNGKISIENFVIQPTIINKVNAELSLNNNILYLKNIVGTLYNGKIVGSLEHSLPYLTTNAKIQGRNINAERLSIDQLPKEQKISGILNFDTNIQTLGLTPEQFLKTAKGEIDLLINNGHLGQLGRFEHFLYAQNLLSQKFLNTSINSAKQAIKPKDTGYITYLKGKLLLSNGTAKLSPIITSGPQMSMFITGYINLLSNYTDLEILGKISSEVSNTMGSFGSMTLKDFIKEHTKYGENIDKIFKNYNSELPEIDISQIPNLTPDYKYQTKNFRVLIIGNPQSVKSVKSFTWVNPIGTNSQILDKTNNDKDLNTSAIKQNNNVRQNREPMQSSVQVSQPNFLDSIPDYFHD